MMHWMAMDGRYGDHFVVPSSETIRLCLSTCTSRQITNNHYSMGVDANARFQRLELVRVTRPETRRSHSGSHGLCAKFLDPWRDFTFRYIVVSVLGWLLIACNIAAAFLLGYQIGAVFLICVCFSGTFVCFLHGNRPRSFLRNDPSNFPRIVITSQHANSTDWKVFYGDSRLLNSLLNLPLHAEPSPHPRRIQALRILLRLSILVQWACALAASVLKDWNSLFISLWIVFCVVSQTYLIPPDVAAENWMRSQAAIKMERCHVTLSSRRALLSTLLALNPDVLDPKAPTSTACIDLILKQGPERDQWEEALKRALAQTGIMEKSEADEVASGGSKEGFWKSPRFEWPTGPGHKLKYWVPYTTEGIYIAAKLRLASGLLSSQANG
ncbi:hypothetical protein LZ30DRAFT_82095 [Colletotrichum cereale]|nr:hypothetical protein LZ30DRAFT_82095 [Colletotrichum cereale]